MIQRAKGNRRRETYYDKGIRVCDEWLTFENFLRDMGERPPGNYSLERIDNSKGYEKSNCKWATTFEQAKNRSNTRWITYEGATLSLAETARKYGLTKELLKNRLNAGRTIEEALTTPPGKLTVEPRPQGVDGRWMPSNRPPKVISKSLTFNGVTKFIPEWTKELSFPPNLIQSRLGNGWSVERALTQPHVPRASPRP